MRSQSTPYGVQLIENKLRDIFENLSLVQSRCADSRNVRATNVAMLHQTSHDDYIATDIVLTHALRIDLQRRLHFIFRHKIIMCLAMFVFRLLIT